MLNSLFIPDVQFTCRPPPISLTRRNQIAGRRSVQRLVRPMGDSGCHIRDEPLVQPSNAVLRDHPRQHTARSECRTALWNQHIPQIFGVTWAVKDWATILPSLTTNVSVPNSYTFADVSPVHKMHP